MPTPLHGAEADVQHLCCFLLREFVVPEQIEGFSLFFRERIDSLVESRPCFQRRGFFRITRLSIKRTALIVSGLAIRVMIRPESLLSPMFQRQVKQFPTNLQGRKIVKVASVSGVMLPVPCKGE